MKRYKVNRPFVDYGIYHGVGEILSDASIISNLSIKIWDNTLEIIDDEGTTIDKPEETTKVEELPKEPVKTVVTPTPVAKPVAKTAVKPVASKK